MITATEALERLRQGNERFVAGSSKNILQTGSTERAALVDGQNPFAIILGCSDSRAPAELIFDQGLGDLFVIRVAGNIVAPSQIGSIEFAAERFGTQLVVVLGHSHCGAVLATLEELKRPQENRSPNLAAIVDRVRPAVETLLSKKAEIDENELEQAAVRANVRASVEQLRGGSDILARMIDDNKLVIVGAEYSLESGRVDFLDSSGKAR